MFRISRAKMTIGLCRGFFFFSLVQSSFGQSAVVGKVMTTAQIPNKISPYADVLARSGVRIQINALATISYNSAFGSAFAPACVEQMRMALSTMSNQSDRFPLFRKYEIHYDLINDQVCNKFINNLSFNFVSKHFSASALGQLEFYLY